MNEALFTVNNLWILIATVLVFIMHLGFSMLEAGFVQKKNSKKMAELMPPRSNISNPE